MTTDIMGGLIVFLIIVSLILFILLAIYVRKYNELLEENMIYRQTIQTQNNIRGSCLAAYRAMLNEANKR